MLLLMAIACNSNEDDCVRDSCPGATGDGELCCNFRSDPCGGEDCWYRADGVDYCESEFVDYIDYCYPGDYGDYGGGGEGGGGGGGTIYCNDGTRSPSCTSCSSGCCSGHGGCS